MHLNAAVVFDEAEFAKAIHEEADPRAGGPDHLCQGFLGDLRDQAFRFARHAELRHQEENPGQPLFAGVEKLVHQVSLRAHAAGKEKLEEKIGASMLFVHHADHLRPLYFEGSTGDASRSCRQAASQGSGNRLFSYKVAYGEQGNGGFLTCCRNDRQLSSPLEQIKNGVGLASLGKEGLVWLELVDPSAQASTG